MSPWKPQRRSPAHRYRVLAKWAADEFDVLELGDRAAVELVAGLDWADRTWPLLHAESWYGYYGPERGQPE